MTDQFKVIHTDETYAVELRVTKRVREFVGISNYRNEPKEASVPREVETEVEAIQFTRADLQGALQRAIRHLTVISEGPES